MTIYTALHRAIGLARYAESIPGLGFYLSAAS